MAKKNEKLSANEVLVNKTEGWISTHRNVIFVSCILVVAIVAVALIITLVSDKGSSNIDSSLYALSSSYEDYLVMDSDDENYEKTLQSIKEEAEELVEKAGVKKYAGAKAQLILADIAYSDGDYSLAEELYKSVYEGQKKTYLGQVALMSYATAAEENGDKSLALSLYNQVFDEYGLEGIYASRSLFNSARLTEESDKDLAVSIYEQLIGEFEESNSEYAKLAESRVSQLKLSK